MLTALLLIGFVFAAEQPLYSRDNLPKAVGDLGIEGSFRTSEFTGAFTYDYRIEVPPGTNGLTPQLGIFYVSQRTPGVPTVLGTGWDFTQTYIERDTNGTVYSTSDDKFKLVLEGNSYDLVFSSADNKYHTKIESFLYIENKTGGNNTKGQYWIIREKDGKTYRLGFNNESEFVGLQSVASRWYVDLINDTYGNSIFYSYLENPHSNDGNATYIANITYNNDKKRVINFIYETTDRPDIWATYDDGNRIKYARRLKEIGIFANNTLVRKYVVGYANIDTTARTLISNITIFGNDGVTRLPSTSFEYNAVKTGFVDSAATYNLPYCITDQSSQDFGVRFVDVNGDGLTDIIRGYYPGVGSCTDVTIKKAFINNGSGWVENSSWQPPYCLNHPGVRTVDANGDGLIDIVMSYQSQPDGDCNFPDVKWALINNGNGWSLDNRWIPPRCISHAGKDSGTRLAEVNGDGLIDVIASQSHDGNCENHTLYTKRVFINNGTTWVQDSNWSRPYCIVENSGADIGVRVIDVNGDGLDDIVRSQQTVDDAPCETPNAKWTLINNGSGWAEDLKWSPPYCFVASSGADLAVRLIDANGDNLIDIVRSHQPSSNGNCTTPSIKKALINNGTGWVENVSWEPQYCFVDYLVPDAGVRITDINGDGLADIVRSQAYEICDNATGGVRKVFINNASQSYLLNTIRNGQGGTIVIGYNKSTALNNTGNDTLGDLGFNLWIVSRIIQNNGMGGFANITSTYMYNYSGGLYDYQDREFRGFNSSQETRPDGTKIVHYFHQDDARPGREYRTEILDSASNIYQRKDIGWNYTSTPNKTFVTELRNETIYTFDGQAGSPRITYTEYRYDNFGNIIEKSSFGDMNSTGNGENEIFEYVYNTASWIVNKPSFYHMAAEDLSFSRDINYSYDNLQHGAVPTKGSLTKKEESLADGSTAITRYGYNSFGNLINTTDPNGHTATYTYGSVDTTFTYPDQEINAKGHVTKYTYDLGLGKILSVTDPNNFTTSYVYDTFGRASKEIRPFDTLTYPTKGYEYERDGVAPERTKVVQREQSATTNTYDTFEYIDGLGNVIQTKKESDDSRQIVVNTVYDGMGRVSTRSNPYKANAQTGYTQPSVSVNFTNFTYDSMDRVVKIKNPDGTQKLFNYSRWNITITDENGNKRHNVLDEFGRIIQVIEFNGNEQYRTNYTYNAIGNLLTIKDSQNNVFAFTYDDLGRKTSMKDPDMGSWSYVYDAAGNLIRQKDNRSITTDFQYDELSRLTRKNSSTESVIFVYDTGMNGTLSKMQSGNDNINLTYDARLRVTKETKTAENVTLAFNYTYDSMDRMVTAFKPDGSNITYTYTDQNTMKSVSNALNNISYNELDLIERRIYNKTPETNFTYDPQNLRLIRINASSLQDLRYSYDNASNIVFINDTIHQRIYRMAYDGLNRLITANRTDNGTFAYIFSYTYNSIGNLLKIVAMNGNITYTYGQAPVHAPSAISIPTDINLVIQARTLNETYFRNDKVNLTDPPEDARTASTDTTTNSDGTYTLTLYSGTRNVFEDGQWKRIEEARSLKGVLQVVKNEDPNFPVDIIDFNYTSITIDIGASPEKLNKDIDLRVYNKFNHSKPLGRNGVEKNKDKKVKLVTSAKQRQIIDLSDTKESALGLEIKWGDASTTIQLKAPDTENLNDAEIGSHLPDSENGANPLVYIINHSSSNDREFILEFNITQVPSNSVINSAKLCLYALYNDMEAGEGFNISANHVWNNFTVDGGRWDEGNETIWQTAQTREITWNKRPGAGYFNQSYTDTQKFTNGATGQYCWDVTDIIRMQYGSFNKGNATIWMRTHDMFGTPTSGEYIVVKAKEDPIAADRPYLNITYSATKATPEANQSKIVNNGSTTQPVYLLMKVQYYNGTTWLDEATIINDTIARNLSFGQTLALDTIWNAVSWNTSSSTRGYGTYRVWAAATDQNDVILQNNNGSQVIATYNFTYGPVQVSNLTTKYINSTQRIYGFAITNRHNSTLSSVSWKLNTGQSTISSQLPITLNADETILVYIYHNYTSPGSYNIIAAATSNSVSHSQKIEITI